MLQYQSLHFERLTSTMDVARHHFQEGPLPWPHVLALTAGTQTQGRGRHGRTWQSPEGNFFGTFALAPPFEQQAYPHMALLVALAVFQALAPLFPADLVHLKWPNDLLLDKKKVAGVLLETCTTHKGTALLVGVGVNLQQSPTEALFPATNLQAYGVSLSSAQFLEHMKRTLNDCLELYLKEGFDPIQQAWSQAAYKKEALLIKGLRQEEGILGTFHALDELGRLQLTLTDGTLHTFNTGDVFLEGTVS